jgi:hypothetical protein
MTRSQLRQENEMPEEILNLPGTPLARLVEMVDERQLALPQGQRQEFVGCDLLAANRVLSRIQAEGLAPGSVLCEWGSGLGGVCGVAALNGFNAFGIEIQQEFVASAHSIAKDLDLNMSFAEGTFLLPGDEDLARKATIHTRLTFNDLAWKKLDLTPEGCDVVFAYPWPREEAFIDSVFARHASPDALLMTFHDHDRVLVQRKVEGNQDLMTLGWM